MVRLDCRYNKIIGRRREAPSQPATPRDFHKHTCDPVSSPVQSSGATRVRVLTKRVCTFLCLATSSAQTTAPNLSITGEDANRKVTVT
jgi:hypothetical protein